VTTPVLYGSQRPRFWTCPPRHTSPVEGCRTCALISGDYEPGTGCGDAQALDVLAWARDAAGYEPDPWQEWVLTNALGTEPDSTWAASDVGLIVSRQNGKGCQSLDTPVYTRAGWKTFATILPGDEVVGSDGKFTRVLSRTPVFNDRDCYEVEFSDGAVYTVDAGHLWHARHKDRRTWQDVRTDELAQNVGGPRPDNGRNEFNWRVRCDAVPDLAEAVLPVDPYLLGFWLGDGTHKAAQVTVGEEDTAWVAERLYAAGARPANWGRADGPLQPEAKDGTAYTLRFRLDADMRDGFESRLKRLGVWGNKHIPEVYLTASRVQRQLLLAGLMDSDGSITRNNATPQCEFTTSFPAIADGFHRLARSLGIRVKPAWRVTSRRDNCRFLWTPSFNPFELPRKTERWRPPVSNRHELMSVVRVTPVSSVPVRCISVQAADGVYLTGHLFTPTHNTVLEIRELGGLFVLGEELIIHTSHEFKDLDTETLILTANRGWTTMGDLVTGDQVYAPDGTPTRLIAHPWLYSSTCYRVTFADGQEITAGAGHLWDVTEAWLYNGKTERKVVTTQQMLDAGLVHTSKNPHGGRFRHGYRWRVDLPKPFTAPDQELLVDPWLLGMWLGDGTSSTGALSVGQEDLSYVTNRLADLGEVYRLRQDLRTGVWTVRVEGLTVKLRVLGVLNDKNVPGEYLTASVKQRRELLAGIMDSDGTVSAHQLAVTMIDESMMQQVLQLVRSLGYRATLRKFRASLKGVDAGPMYRVQFAPNGISPFGLPRKTTKIVQLRTSRSAYNAVVSIEPVETRPTRCITVEHPSGCYLVGTGFTVTHNTSAEHFRRVKAVFDDHSALRKRVKRIAGSHGEEAIELFPQPTLIFGPGRKQITRRVAGRLRFLARSKGSGRGFSCDCLVYDEAMILSEDQVAASLPTMSARANPQIWYAGSAGNEDSFQFAAVRQRIVRNSKDLFGAEWSIDPHNDACPRDELTGRETNYFITCTKHDDRDDPRSWAKANPGYGYRISEKFTRNTEMANMPPQKFDMERLAVGKWPQPEAPWAVISEIAWNKLAVSQESAGFPVQPIVFALDIDEDGRSATISAAWDHPGSKRVVLEIPKGCSRQGTDWVLEKADQLYKKRQPIGIAIPKSGPAAALIPGGTKLWRERCIAVGTAEEAAAFAWLLQQVRNDNLWHFGREGAPTLWHAVATAATRVVGDGGKAWSRRDSESDITPVTSATLAAYVLDKYRRSYDLMDSVA
jgi:hypothetical protein